MEESRASQVVVAYSPPVLGDIQVFKWRLEATTTHLKIGSESYGPEV